MALSARRCGRPRLSRIPASLRAPSWHATCGCIHARSAGARECVPPPTSAPRQLVPMFPAVARALHGARARELLLLCAPSPYPVARQMGPMSEARHLAPARASEAQARRAHQTWVSELQFYQAQILKSRYLVNLPSTFTRVLTNENFYQGKDLRINWKKPIASGNFGSVFYGSTPDGRQCVVKCPVLDEFALKLFDTERAVNIKLSQQTGQLSVPWATMLGEVNIPEPIPMDSDLARIGIVWEKEGQVNYLHITYSLKGR